VSVAVPSAYAPSRRVRSVAASLGLGAVAAATGGAIALAHGDVRNSTTTIAVTTVIAGCAFVGGGIVAWLRRPANRTGLLMIATGFLLFGSSLAQASRPLPFTIGLAVSLLPAALVGHLVLAFPEGRLHSRWERAVVSAGYFVVTVVQVVMLMFMGFEHVNGCPCPSNLLFVRDDMRLHSAIMSSQRVLGIVLAVCAGALLARRWRGASPPLRRAVVPLFVTGALTIVLLAAELVTDGPAPGLSRGLAAAQKIALATVPIAFLLGLFNARLARASVSDLVLELGRMPAPGRLRDALARALGDASLELAYWIPESETYVGIDGRPVEIRADEERSVTVLERRGRKVAALVHDPALGEHQELLDAVSSAAGLALENEQLQAELRAQLEELRDSRARIVEAGDNARRRLERNLHDGAQQRLVALSVALGLAETKLSTDPQGAASVLASAREGLATGLAELREIARGLHPAILSRGLEVALAGIAERAPLPVELDLDIGERPPEHLEAAAYYVVAEALTNVARYANASAASVRVTRETAGVRVEVSDDGVGGAAISPGSGLEGLRDRVEAAGGRLELESPPAGGTRISAFLPAGQATVAERTFVPDRFVVPHRLETPQFRLEPLGPEHNDADYAAWRSSVDHIHATPGWETSSWPDERTAADNLRDLQRHADDFAHRRGFTYTVLDPLTAEIVGCVYIYPDRSDATDAHVQSWVRASRAELDLQLWQAVSDWLDSRWPFRRVDYAPRRS
jgi:signal transduction histidine kinase